MDDTRHRQHWLTALPTPYTEALLRQGSLHLGILHKLVRICRWAIYAYTYRQKKIQLNSQWIQLQRQSSTTGCPLVSELEVL